MTKVVSLGKIVKVIRNGMNAQQVDDQADGMYPISRIETISKGTIDFARVKYVNVTAEKKKKYALQSGDILFSHINSPTHIGKTALYREDTTLIHGINLLLIRVDQEQCYPEYLNYYFNTYDVRTLFRTRCKKAVNQASLNQGDILELSVPLPPLPEQKRTAAQLAQADRLRQLRRNASQLGESYLQSVFLAMFGDPANNTHNFPIESLGSLIDGFEAGVNYLPDPDGRISPDWRVLKISAVTRGDFNPKESKAIGRKVEFDKNHIVRRGDLLISRANTTELVGAVSMVRQNPPQVLLPDKLWRIKFSENSKVNPEYILQALRQRSTRKLIEELATGSGGSMKNISMKKAATIPIMVPPLPEQERFAQIVVRYERLRAQMRESTRQAELLFYGLLHESFS